MLKIHKLSPQIKLLLVIIICARVYVRACKYIHTYLPLNINELHDKINEYPICRRQSMRHIPFVAK